MMVWLALHVTAYIGVRGVSEGRKGSWMRGQQTCPRYNIYLYHVNSKHTKASLAAAIGSFMRP